MALTRQEMVIMSVDDGSIWPWWPATAAAEGSFTSRSTFSPARAAARFVADRSVDEDGGVLVGRAARDRLISHPERTAGELVVPKSMPMIAISRPAFLGLLSLS